MLIRCNVDDHSGLLDLDQCRILGTYFKQQGYQIAYAINREGYESARTYLSEEATIYRLAGDLDEQANRLSHLGRTHKHRVVITHLRQTSSTYLFQLKRSFKFSLIIDHGSAFQIYGNLLINPNFNAHDIRYLCTPGLRMLLGPKYHICDPRPIEPPPAPQVVEAVLINLGHCGPLIEEILLAVGQLEAPPRIDIIATPQEILNPILERVEALHPNLDIQIASVTREGGFNYRDYALQFTEAGDSCTEYARQGLFFITAAVVREQLKKAYVLDQLGVAPTLGWFSSQKAPAIYELLRQLLADVNSRARHAKMGSKLVDGQGLLRIARFVPAETDTTSTTDEKEPAS